MTERKAGQVRGTNPPTRSGVANAFAIALVALSLLGICYYLYDLIHPNHFVGDMYGMEVVFRVALLFLPVIALVVGGVVLMNVMLVSVTERTREVGLRKALGARKSNIVWQFIVESITLSLVGGIAGIAIGFTIAAVISMVSPLPYVIAPWSIAAGLIVTFLIGLIFGTYPAGKAANLDPVVALHHE